MSCEGCIQKIVTANAQKSEILTKAAELAAETGQAYAIYTDGTGKKCCIPAAQSAGYPVEGYISPKYRNLTVQNIP